LSAFSREQSQGKAKIAGRQFTLRLIDALQPVHAEELEPAAGLAQPAKLKATVS